MAGTNGGFLPLWCPLGGCFRSPRFGLSKGERASFDRVEMFGWARKPRYVALGMVSNYLKARMGVRRGCWHTLPE